MGLKAPLQHLVQNKNTLTLAIVLTLYRDYTVGVGKYYWRSNWAKLCGPCGPLFLNYGVSVSFDLKIPCV